MKGITDKQRRTFFMIVNHIGKDNAYEVMKGVCGKESLKEVSYDEMKRVLKELIEVSNIEIKIKPKKKKFRNPLRVKQGSKIIKLATHKQLQYIEYLKEQVGFDDKKFESFCMRIIKREKPLRREEAQAIIAALKGMHYVRWKAQY